MLSLDSEKHKCKIKEQMYVRCLSFIPGHLRLEDEGFEEKKALVPLMLVTLLGVLGLAFTNVN